MTDLFQAYRTFFGKGDAVYQLFSPYRICPLGAHVDHQHGLVSGFAFNSAIDKIGRMPAPFVKYCSVIWNKDFDDPTNWDSITEEE